MLLRRGNAHFFVKGAARRCLPRARLSRQTPPEGKGTIRGRHAVCAEGKAKYYGDTKTLEESLGALAVDLVLRDIKHAS